MSKATYEKYADLCSTSYLPMGIDDPKSKGTICDLVISLFERSYDETWREGANINGSDIVISANFTTVEQGLRSILNKNYIIM